MDIVSFRIQSQFFLLRDPGEVLGLSASRASCILEILLRFFICAAGEIAGDDIVGRASLGKIQRKSREHTGRAALQEQDLIVVRNIHDLAQILLSIADDLVIHLGTVAHLHDGHSAAFIVQHILLGFQKYLFRKHGRTCGKVIDSVLKHNCTSSIS